MHAHVVQEPNMCEKADASKQQYREYLLERLRVPAGVVFGHGIVNLALIQVTEDFCIHCNRSVSKPLTCAWCTPFI